MSSLARRRALVVMSLVGLGLTGPVGLGAAGLGTAPARADDRHAFYVEALGKGGLYGVGYDVRLPRQLALGAVASHYVLSGDRFTRVAPYLAVYPWRPWSSARHRWFMQAGPQWVRRHTPSPGPEWPGKTSMSLDAELSAGYEYRHGLLVRAYAMASWGTRLVPWLGASVGWSL
ncbi:MAG: hypothetical protein IPI49_15815 [Myxococcales bacterium]|nr:hypothetical protein [Myxococcales bacterium]HRC56259.1 hypothetical protein [Kofleriaceae bacterium]